MLKNIISSWINAHSVLLLIVRKDVGVFVATVTLLAVSVEDVVVLVIDGISNCADPKTSFIHYWCLGRSKGFVDVTPASITTAEFVCITDNTNESAFVLSSLQSTWTRFSCWIKFLYPVKNFPKKKTLKNAFQKIKALFLRKENVPKIMESVPKWNDLEHILLALKRFPSETLFRNDFLFFQISYIFGHIVDHQRINP